MRLQLPVSVSSSDSAKKNLHLELARNTFITAKHAAENSTSGPVALSLSLPSLSLPPLPLESPTEGVNTTRQTSHVHYSAHNDNDRDLNWLE